MGRRQRLRAASRAWSWSTSPIQGLAGVGDLPHQNGRCLEIPVDARDTRVAKISTEGDNLMRHSIAIMRTAFQSADGKGVAEIVDARLPLPTLTLQTDCPG